MTPEKFPEANTQFSKPTDLEESQCMPIEGYFGAIEQGSLEGAPVIVTCWRPSPEELAALNAGRPLFLTFVTAELPPHYPSLDFHSATHPA